MLEIADLEVIMDNIFRNFRCAEDIEITIEANPGDMTRDKVHEFKSIGINRVNLGVQSFIDRELIFLGRRHNAEEAINSINCLRSGGIDNLGRLFSGKTDKTDY